MGNACREENRLCRFLPALIVAAGLFFLVYRVVMGFMGGDSDYIDHMLWALSMDGKDCLQSFVDGSERLWHVCVKGMMALTGNMWRASALVTAAADTAAYVLVFCFFDECLPRKFSRCLLAALTGAVFLVNALYVPGLSADFYTTKGAVNTWHNPTSIMVRPFAAAVFYMTVRLYNRYRFGEDSGAVSASPPRDDFPLAGRRFFSLFRDRVYKPAELALYPACLLLSAWAKPSFLQVFGPAVLVFLLIDLIRTRGRLLPFCLKLAAAYLPAALVVLAQFSGFFGGTAAAAAGTAAAGAGTAAAASSGSSAGIVVYLFSGPVGGLRGVLKAAGEWLAPFLWLCAWPVFILLVDPGAFWRSSGGRLAVLNVAAGRLETMLLHETGYRAGHGNFYWGFYLAVLSLWCAAMGRFVRLLGQGGKKRAAALWIGCPLLGWHLISGIAYCVKILQTGQYMF